MSCLQNRHLACTDCHAIWLQKKTWCIRWRSSGSCKENTHEHLHKHNRFIGPPVEGSCPTPALAKSDSASNWIVQQHQKKTKSWNLFEPMNPLLTCWLPCFFLHGDGTEMHWANDLLMVVEEEEEQKPSLEQSLNIIAWAFLPCIIPLPIWHATCIHGLNPWTNCTRHAHPANFTPPNQTQSLE